MLIQHVQTGEFYTQETLNVLDVSANTIGMAVIQEQVEDLEGYINRTFQKCRGDHFQLIKTTEYREKTLKLLCGSDNVWTGAYQVKNRKMEVVKTLKWTGKKFVEVI